MNLILYLWLGMYECIYLIQFFPLGACGQEHLGMPKVIPNIKITVCQFSNSQYVKAEVNYGADFLYMCRYLQEQQEKCKRQKSLKINESCFPVTQPTFWCFEIWLIELLYKIKASFSHKTPVYFDSFLQASMSSQSSSTHFLSFRMCT